MDVTDKSVTADSLAEGEVPSEKGRLKASTEPQVQPVLSRLASGELERHRGRSNSGGGED